MAFRIRSNAHAHTDMVDGKSPAEETVRAALAAGMVSLGFTEHAPQPFDPVYCLSEAGEETYIAQIDALKEKYRGQIRVYRGIELDAYALSDPKRYELVLGSVHYLPCGDEMIAVDSAPQDVERLIREGFDGDRAGMAVAYFEAVERFARRGAYDICAHFDLPRKYNRDFFIYHEDDPGVMKSALRALEAVRAAGALMEVNTGAMARGYQDLPYPAMPLLARWREMGGGVIVSSDCHLAKNVAFGFDAALACVRAAGFDSLWRLGGEGEEKFVREALPND